MVGLCYKNVSVSSGCNSGKFDADLGICVLAASREECEQAGFIYEVRLTHLLLFDACLQSCDMLSGARLEECLICDQEGGEAAGCSLGARQDKYLQCRVEMKRCETEEECIQTGICDDAEITTFNVRVLNDNER